MNTYDKPQTLDHSKKLPDSGMQRVIMGPRTITVDQLLRILQEAAIARNNEVKIVFSEGGSIVITNISR